jgi:hypothetical protein
LLNPGFCNGPRKVNPCCVVQSPGIGRPIYGGRDHILSRGVDDPDYDLT